MSKHHELSVGVWTWEMSWSKLTTSWCLSLFFSLCQDLHVNQDDESDDVTADVISKEVNSVFLSFIPGLSRLSVIFCPWLALAGCPAPCCDPVLTHTCCSGSGEAGGERRPAEGSGRQAGSSDRWAGEDVTEPELLWEGAASPRPPDTAPVNHIKGEYLYTHTHTHL